MKQLIAVIALAWAIGCWAAFFWLAVIGQFALAIGVAFASFVAVILLPGEEAR